MPSRDVRQSDVVGVGVENHHAQTRPHQEALEYQPQRVRLAGAGLTAHERVPVEPSGIERCGHTRSKQQLTDRQRGATGRTRTNQASTSLGGRRPDRRVVEGLARPSRTMPSPRATWIPWTRVERTSGAAIESGRMVRIWPRRVRSVALEHHVPAGLQGEPVQRGLEGEPATVHRRGQRENPSLQLLATGRYTSTRSVRSWPLIQGRRQNRRTSGDLHARHVWRTDASRFTHRRPGTRRMKTVDILGRPALIARRPGR